MEAGALVEDSVCARTRMERSFLTLLILLIALTLVNAFMLWKLIDIVTRIEILTPVDTFPMVSILG